MSTQRLGALPNLRASCSNSGPEVAVASVGLVLQERQAAQIRRRSTAPQRRQDEASPPTEPALEHPELEDDVVPHGRPVGTSARQHIVLAEDERREIS